MEPQISGTEWFSLAVEVERDTLANVGMFTFAVDRDPSASSGIVDPSWDH